MPTATAEFDPSEMMDLLPIYYRRLFPTNLMYRWLSYGEDVVFSKREFSFVLPGDVYIRYQSFSNKEEFEKELLKRTPEKIDIGAVFNHKPKLRETVGALIPVQKEFVLDIDLTDYDEVRSCCSGAKVCQKCWKFLGVAVQILDAALKDDFGFNELLWVFSGRRGVHCWVCDEKARFLDGTARSAVVEYLQVIRGGENQAKKVRVGPRLHSSIERALKVIDNNFESICLEDQEIFENELGQKIIETLHFHPELSKKIQSLQSSHASSRKCWAEVQAYCYEKEKDKAVLSKPRIIPEIQLQYCYPRLDINVSKGMNHLLKSPFCVHPKTGQICVPFDPEKVFEFKIPKVPTLNQLVEEINAHDAKHANASNIKDWKKTALEESMAIFSLFVKGLEREKLKKKVLVVKPEAMEME